MLPYAAVGKSAEVWGWDARHALLLPVPLALVIVGFVRPLARRVPPRTLAVAAAVVIGAMALTAERAHLAWEGRWAKDLAFIDALRSEPVLRDRSVLIVRDELPLVPGDVYRSYELTAMAHAAWGGRARAVLREGDPLLTEGLSASARREYLMDEFHDDGCRTVIFVRPVGAVLAAVALGADYVRAELAGSPAAADAAKPLLRLESMPLPGPRSGDTQ